MFQVLFGKKMTDEEKKRKLKNKINKLVTNNIKEKLWNKYYNNEYDVYCYYCKRVKINPFNCYWIHLSIDNTDIEDNIVPVCENCDIINDNTFFI